MRTVGIIQDGNTCSMEYDDRHKETWFTFSDTGRWEHYYYDEMEHVVCTERGVGKEAKEKILVIQQRLGHRTEEAFAEIRGLEGISKVIQPEQYQKETDDGEGMEYRYDAGNRLQEVIDPNGTAIRRFLYDTAGRLTEERDANGNAALYSYNYAGWRVCQVICVSFLFYFIF